MLLLHNYGFLDGKNKSLFFCTTIVLFEYIFCLETCSCSVPPAMLSKRHVTSYKTSLSKENNVDTVDDSEKLTPVTIAKLTLHYFKLWFIDNKNNFYLPQYHPKE